MSDNVNINIRQYQTMSDNQWLEERTLPSMSVALTLQPQRQFFLLQKLIFQVVWKLYSYIRQKPQRPIFFKNEFSKLFGSYIVISDKIRQKPQRPIFFKNEFSKLLASYIVISDNIRQYQTKSDKSLKENFCFKNEFSKLLASYEPKIAPSRVSRLLHNGCRAQPRDELLLSSQRYVNSEKEKVKNRKKEKD